MGGGGGGGPCCQREQLRSRHPHHLRSRRSRQQRPPPAAIPREKVPDQDGQTTASPATSTAAARSSSPSSTHGQCQAPLTCHPASATAAAAAVPCHQATAYEHPRSWGGKAAAHGNEIQQWWGRGHAAPYETIVSGSAVCASSPTTSTTPCSGAMCVRDAAATPAASHAGAAAGCLFG